MAREGVLRARDRAVRPRYETIPCGGGSWGVYDHLNRRWIQAYTGSGARSEADRKLREVAGAP